MVLRFFLFACIFLFVSCHTVERDNPDDPNGTNYRGGLFPGSSSPSVNPSSSSSRASSSSSVPSSSSSIFSSSSKQSSSSNSTQVNIDYGPDVPYDGGPYKTVVIGGKTWFQRNLNYNVSGSKCGVGGTGTIGSLSESNTTTCDTHGRLYDWATAMALPSECNSKLSTSDAECTIRTPHKGICPTGWHIPSDAEWTALETAVGGSSTAGKYLKATNGWNSGGNGEDKFGFAALPGGLGSGGSFSGVGGYGNWWSASENNANSAYYRNIYYYNENVNRDLDDKSVLFSVRCVED